MKEERVMTESSVHNIVLTAFDKYEREIAQPRHTENVARLTQLTSTMDKIDGGVTAIKHILRYLGGFLAGLYALVKIIELAKGVHV